MCVTFCHKWKNSVLRSSLKSFVSEFSPPNTASFLAAAMRLFLWSYFLRTGGLIGKLQNKLISPLGKSFSFMVLAVRDRDTLVNAVLNTDFAFSFGVNPSLASAFRLGS